jgi:hypothetical protein
MVIIFRLFWEGRILSPACAFGEINLMKPSDYNLMIWLNFVSYWSSFHSFKYFIWDVSVGPILCGRAFCFILWIVNALFNFWLQFSGNNIKLEGVKLIVPAFATLTSLEGLDLGGKFYFLMLSCSRSNFLSAMWQITTLEMKELLFSLHIYHRVLNYWILKVSYVLSCYWLIVQLVSSWVNWCDLWFFREWNYFIRDWGHRSII